LTQSSTTKEFSKEASLRVVHALIELLAHSVVVAGLVITIWLIEKLVHWLWGSVDYVFFGRVKLGYIFDAADLAILGVSLFGAYTLSSGRMLANASHELIKQIFTNSLV
jgi:hypothetical protein